MEVAKNVEIKLFGVKNIPIAIFKGSILKRKLLLVDDFVLIIEFNNAQFLNFP